MSSFIFGVPPPVHCAISVKITSGISDKKILLTALADEMQFPDYFGMNWDALNECICDLSWLPAGHVNLIHNDVPMLNDKKELRTYLSILEIACKKWDTTGSNLIFICPENKNRHLVDELIVHRKLFISFPVGAMESVVCD